VVPGRSLRERSHVSVASARHQWDDGRRRLAEEGLETARSRHLAVLIDAVTDELRRRLGQRYTLADLAAAYDGAEEWVRDVVLRSARPKFRAGVRDTALVQDAAFARYAQGASDYEP
jgi:hypothetical protein